MCYNYKIFQVTDFIQGEYQDIVTIFAEKLNFTLRQFLRFDGAWGSFDKQSGKWSGMISNMVNGEADLSIFLGGLHLVNFKN